MRRYGLPPYDRSEDPPPLFDAPADVKPPVLRRSTLRWLSAACLTAIVFGTLGPLGVGPGPWLEPVSAWRWVPLPRPSDVDDVVTNLIVYLPVGVAFRLLVRRRGWAGALDLGLGFALSVGLSFLTEVLQQFMPARSSNLTDVWINAFGALGGCLLAPTAQDLIRRMHAIIFARLRYRPWTVLAGVAVAGTAVLMTVPWDLTYPRIEVQLQRPLDAADLARFAAFGLVGFALTAAAAASGPTERSRLIRRALKQTGLLAVLLEGAQVFLVSHAAGLLDVLVALLGGLAGGGVALSLWHAGLISPGARHARPRGAPTLEGAWRTLTSAILALTVLGTMVVQLSSGGSSAGAGPRFPIRWVPFAAYFHDSFPTVIAGVAEALAIYASVTLLCLLLTGGRRRAACALLLLALVTASELCKPLFAAGAADVTGLLLAGVAWLSATRVWDAVYPAQPPRAPPRRGLPHAPHPANR